MNEILLFFIVIKCGKMIQYERKSMNNYYETCLEDIKTFIRENKLSDALAMIDEELKMPYVPQPYFDEFCRLRDTLRIDTHVSQQAFDDLDDIQEALKGNERMQDKALQSLAMMNLRAVMDSIETIMTDQYIADAHKKVILKLMMQQEIQGTCEILLSGSRHRLNIGALIDPIDTVAFKSVANKLIELLESNNPSMLILCLGELEFTANDAFPLNELNDSAESILKRVKRYMGEINEDKSLN